MEKRGGWMTLVRRRVFRRFLLKLNLNEIKGKMEVLKLYKIKRRERRRGIDC
jgi:hypothetical protein